MFVINANESLSVVGLERMSNLINEVSMHDIIKDGAENEKLMNALHMIYHGKLDENILIYAEGYPKEIYYEILAVYNIILLRHARLENKS